MNEQEKRSLGGALEGIKVLDLTTLLPGPLATLYLAEAGADVLKIERPGGEDLRRYPPFFDGHSITFEILNRGKRFLELDLKSEEGLRKIRALVCQSDILVEQFRPGVMARLGLDYESLSELNPALVMCSISGYGQIGPRAFEAGHDINYMGLTGLLNLSRGSLDQPVLPPTQIADIGGGSFPAIMNILLALVQKARTGQGTFIDIAMSDAMFTFAPFAFAEMAKRGAVSGSGEMLLTGASPRYGLYATRDDRLIAVGALEEKFWSSLCRAVDLAPTLWNDQVDPAATKAGLADCFRAREAKDWQPILQAADCCATVVRDLRDALQDEHFIERGLFDGEIDLETGKRFAALPLPIAPELRRNGSSRR